MPYDHALNLAVQPLAFHCGTTACQTKLATAATIQLDIRLPGRARPLAKSAETSASQMERCKVPSSQRGDRLIEFADRLPDVAVPLAEFSWTPACQSAMPLRQLAGLSGSSAVETQLHIVSGTADPTQVNISLPDSADQPLA